MLPPYKDTRLVGPVDRRHGLVKVADDQGSNRKCNCCGEWLIKINWFSYNAPRKDYSYTCKSCKSWIWLFSQEFAADERARPKRKRRNWRTEPIAEEVGEIPQPDSNEIRTHWQTQWYDPINPLPKRKHHVSQTTQPNVVH